MNISSNLTSIYNNQNSINDSASRVANISAEDSTTDLSNEIPTQMTAQKAIEADALSIKTQDEILGTLLDIKA
jgi:flagellar hook protein FlgE